MESHYLLNSDRVVPHLKKISVSQETCCANAVFAFTSGLQTEPVRQFSVKYLRSLIKHESTCSLLEAEAWSTAMELRIGEAFTPVRTGSGLARIQDDPQFFNDFSGDTCVHGYWSDPHARKHGGSAESKLYAQVIADTCLQSNILAITFVRQGWGCSINLRPDFVLPLLSKYIGYLHFRIRSKSINRRIGIRIRLMDINDVVWGFGKALSECDNEPFEQLLTDNRYHTGVYNTADAKQQSMASNEYGDWTDVYLPLKDSGWFHFPFDGITRAEPLTQKPNFLSVTRLSLDVGFEDSPAEQMRCPCPYTGFSLSDKSVGQLHVSPIRFITISGFENLV